MGGGEVLGQEVEGGEGGEGRSGGSGGGDVREGATMVSGGALGMGLGGWLLRYRCTSSATGDCGSVAIEDSKLH